MIRVMFRGSERVLNLVQEGFEWHAQLLIPGSDELFGKIIQPSPPGTILPRANIKEFVLRIEAPAAEVVSMEIGKLLVAGALVKEGWITMPLGSLMRDWIDVGEPQQEQAQIINFPVRTLQR